MDEMHESSSYLISIFAALLILLSLSVFFAICETGFSSANKIKLKNMAEKSKGRAASQARLALKLLDTYDRILSTILVGNTIVNITATSLAAMFFIDIFGETNGVTISTVVMTVVILIFTEITPKTLARESPERATIGAAPLLYLFPILFAPLNFLTNAWKKVIVKIFPVKGDRSVTEDELLTFVEEVRQEGGINQQEEHMIRQVIEFDEITAAEIVTPRIDVKAVCENATIEEIEKLFATTSYSRLPVFHETIDAITGVVLFKDFYYEVIKKSKPFAGIVKPVVYVTKTIKISRLLQTLQDKQSHMAVLVDEFGGTMGIVTIEDIMEELVGEIWDEHDQVVEPIRKNADGSFVVLGNVKFQEMLEYINVKTLPENTEIPNTTIGNWVLEASGVIPRIRETFSWGTLQIKVIKVLRHRVLEVEVEAKVEDVEQVSEQ